MFLRFNVDEWGIEGRTTSGIGIIKQVKFYNNEMVDGFQVGNWGWDWSIIKTIITPKKNTDYTFAFWLNGGENDRFDEVCEFEMWSDEDYDNRDTYKLNREFIKPVKIVNGWNLYEFSFNSGNAEKITLRFNVCGAPTTIVEALPVENYADLLSEESDPQRTQRHNCVFENGFYEENSRNNASQSILDTNVFSMHKSLGGNNNIGIDITVRHLLYTAGIIGGISLVRKAFKKKK